ncbi:MAG: PAS domain-containing protein, partial [Muribaculaceae bacterium]|nr:PAS domain-containing protein [Muribaculaceae bacterium]
VRLFNSMIDRLRNERLLNMERESFLHLLVAASPMGVLMLDLDGKITMANDAFLNLCGIKEFGELEGKKIAELPDNLKRWLEGIPYQESVVFRPGDSRLFKGSHLSFVQSGFNRHFFLLENLTEEVMQAERSAYEKVIRMMSHEVNNTMGGVRTVFGMLLDETEDEDLREVVESCDRRCGEVCTFINDYADVVRLPMPDLKQMNLGDMLAETLPFLRTLAPDDIEICLDVEGELMMKGDRTQLEQVVVNIVKNAVESFNDSRKDYSEGGKRIEIRVIKNGKAIILNISNNGNEILPETASQLFSPFFTTKPDGKGLGLTLTGEILGNHNARWSLQTNENGITVFSINFPNDIR